jgi:hypothetical protein
VLAIRQLAATSIVALSMRLPGCAERAHVKRRCFRPIPLAVRQRTERVRRPCHRAVRAARLLCKRIKMQSFIVP